MPLLTLYGRREPTTDSVFLQHGSGPMKRDLVLYSDVARTQVMARIPWYQRACRARKRVTINCYIWNLEIEPATP